MIVANSHQRRWPMLHGGAIYSGQDRPTRQTASPLLRSATLGASATTRKSPPHLAKDCLLRLHSSDAFYPPAQCLAIARAVPDMTHED